MSGARFRFDRLAVEGSQASYAVLVELPEGSCSGTAHLGPAGVSLEPFSPPPPPWAIEQATALLRTVAKNHAGDGDWPRRVHRWRAPRGA
jgi:hypothetical protein